MPGGVAPKFGSEKVSRYTGVSQLQLRVSRYTVQLSLGRPPLRGGRGILYFSWLLTILHVGGLPFPVQVKSQLFATSAICGLSWDGPSAKHPFPNEHVKHRFRPCFWSMTMSMISKRQTWSFDRSGFVRITSVILTDEAWGLWMSGKGPFFKEWRTRCVLFAKVITLDSFCK